MPLPMPLPMPYPAGSAANLLELATKERTVFVLPAFETSCGGPALADRVRGRDAEGRVKEGQVPGDGGRDEGVCKKVPRCEGRVRWMQGMERVWGFGCCTPTFL